MDHSPQQFPTTRWTLVRRAKSSGDLGAKHALNALCSIYWPPIYSFVRNSGYTPEDAEDHTQGFFEKVLRLESFDAADPERGKLRTYLLTGVSHYLKSHHRKDHAGKRDSRKLESFDAWKAEQFHNREPCHGRSPAVLFLRQWTLAVISAAVAKVEEDFAKKNKQALFEAVRPMLDGEFDESKTYVEIASELGMTEDAFKQHVSRTRKKLVRTLRDQVAATLDNPSGQEVDQEVTLLLRCLEESSDNGSNMP